MVVATPNTITDTGDLGAVPVKPDGNWYRYELICHAGQTRCYADSPHELLTYLIDGYGDLTSAHEQGAARTRYAVDVQVRLQARVNATAPNVTTSSEEEAILFGGRADQPTVTTWATSVPLVLVDTFYVPHTDQPAPVSEIADVAAPPNVWWLTPAAGEFPFLESLHNLGVVTLNTAKDVTP